MAVAHVGGIIGTFRLLPQLFIKIRVSPCRGHNQNYGAQLLHLLTRLVVSPCRGHNRNFRLRNAGVRRISRKDLELAHVRGIIDPGMPTGTIDGGRTNWNGHDKLDEQFSRRAAPPLPCLQSMGQRAWNHGSSRPAHSTRLAEISPMEKVLIAHIAVEGAGLMIFGTGSESAWLIGGSLEGDGARSFAVPSETAVTAVCVPRNLRCPSRILHGKPCAHHASCTANPVGAADALGVSVRPNSRPRRH
jgi:hypothetical protein